MDAQPDPLEELIAWRIATVTQCQLPDSDWINPAITRAVEALGDRDFTHRSHFIEGRFENLYLERTRIPELVPLLDHALRCAGLILGRPAETLKCGFWLNLMAPGESTSLHTHEESDELLSAVYYVQVPPDSGDLLLYDGPATIRVRPRSGTFFFFPPDLPHAVETNRGQAARLSIGINVGPR